MQYHQRQAFQADSDDDEDAVMNAPGPNNPDTRYAADDGLDGLDAGEAGEAPSEKRKTTTDQDIAAELAGEVRKAKKSRPTLQPADLVGPNGLNRIKNEFNDQVKYRGVDRAKLKAKGGKKKPTREQLKRAELNAAASYSRDLLGAYRNFCRDLFPSMAFEDTVARIENLSSKKEVKDYVEVMREDVRRQHLVGIYGAAKTDRMLSELESNLVGGAEGYGDDGDGQLGAAAAVVNPYGAGAGTAAGATNTASGTSNPPVVEEEEVEEEVPPASPARDYRGVTRFSQRANPYATSEPTSADKNDADDYEEEEEEEEVEASFDEDVPPTGDAAAFAAADEADKQDQNDVEAQEKDDEEGELEFVDAAPKEKESADDIAAKSTQKNNDDRDEDEDDEEEEQLFFDATQPSQEDASPKELLGQETPSPQSTPEDSTPPSSAEKAAQAPDQEEQQQEPDIDLPETEAFGMPNDMKAMEEDIPTQHVAHDDDDGEEGDDTEELVMDATQETLTNVLPTMTAPDAEENGEGEEGAMSQMSLEY